MGAGTGWPDLGDWWNGLITIVCLLSAFALWLYIRNDERNATPSPVTDLGDELST
jgi:hypothetical protein